MNTNADPAIQLLHLLLGVKTVLIPSRCDPGPRCDSVADLPTFEQSQRFAHQLELAEAPFVSVALGAVSDNLCAVVLPDQIAADAMIAVNPTLRESALRVEHPDGTVALLLRVASPAPATRRDASGFAWLSNGATVTVLVRDTWCAARPGMPAAALKPLRLDTIDWRPLGEFGLALLRETLREQHGGIFSGSVAKKRRLNLPFWAAYLAGVLPLRFHAKRRVFQQQQPGGSPWTELAAASVEKLPW